MSKNYDRAESPGHRIQLPLWSQSTLVKFQLYSLSTLGRNEVTSWIKVAELAITIGNILAILKTQIASILYRY